MGSSLQWRNENGRRPIASGDVVRIGSGRRAADAYLAHSQRAGPGLMILAPVVDGELRAFVDRCRDEGFTAMAPDLSGDSAAEVMRAAAEMLVANWHPRLGVLALPGTGDAAIALDGSVRLDAVVVPAAAGAEPRTRAPGLATDLATEAGLAEALEFLAYHLS
ncbi:MAG: hypothetical protein GEU78_12455 [Actinobacteria bacterium]|nr:hypothetical protein [Actinomycetota bacterium]